MYVYCMFVYMCVTVCMCAKMTQEQRSSGKNLFDIRDKTKIRWGPTNPRPCPGRLNGEYESGQSRQEVRQTDHVCVLHVELSKFIYSCQTII